MIMERIETENDFKARIEHIMESGQMDDLAVGRVIVSFRTHKMIENMIQYCPGQGYMHCGRMFEIWSTSKHQDNEVEFVDKYKKG